MSLLAAPVTSPLNAVEVGLVNHPAFSGPYHRGHTGSTLAPVGQPFEGAPTDGHLRTAPAVSGTVGFSG